VPHSTGDFERSRQFYLEWYEIAVKNGNIQHQAFGLIGQAENYLPVGKISETTEFCERGLQLIIEKTERSFENRTAEIRGTGLLALSYLRQGLNDRAQETADSTMEIIRQLSTPTRISLLESLSGVAEVYLSLWEEQANSAPTTLKTSAKAACKVMGQYARVFRIGEPRAYLWQGLYQWLEGRHDRARTTWAKSLVAAERLSMTHEQALTTLEIGRHAEGKEREVNLGQALEIFEMSGATYFVSKARSILGREETNLS
jgi:hypothetical protein